MTTSFSRPFALILSLMLISLFSPSDAAARPRDRADQPMWRTCLPAPGTYERMAVTAEAKQDLPRLLKWYWEEYPSRPYFGYAYPTEYSRFSCRTLGPVNWGGVNWFYQAITGLKPKKCEDPNGCDITQGYCKNYGECTVNSMRVCSLDYVPKPGQSDQIHANVRTPSGRKLGVHGCAPYGNPTELPFP